jgi:hypothetical protein
MQVGNWKGAKKAAIRDPDFRFTTTKDAISLNHEIAFIGTKGKKRLENEITDAKLGVINPARPKIIVGNRRPAFITKLL